MEERCDAIDAVLATVDATGFTRLLVDFSDADLVVEDLQQLQKLARRLSQDPTLARCRIAYLTPPAPHWDPAVEILAHGRGSMPNASRAVTGRSTGFASGACPPTRPRLAGRSATGEAHPPA